MLPKGILPEPFGKASRAGLPLAAKSGVPEPDEVYVGNGGAPERSLVALGQGWLVSGSYDKTLSLWQVGEELGSGWEGSVCLCGARVTCLVALSESTVGCGNADG